MASRGSRPGPIPYNLSPKTDYSSFCLLPRQLLGISRRIEQRAHRSRIGHAKLDHPAGLVWLGVNQRRLAVEPRVDLDDFAGDRAEQLAHGLDGLDRAERRMRGELRALLGKLEIDDIAEFTLRVVGDSDGKNGRVGSGFYVFVVGRVAEIGWNGRHC